MNVFSVKGNATNLSLHSETTFTGCRREQFELVPSGQEHLDTKVQVKEQLGAESLLYFKATANAQLVTNGFCNNTTANGSTIGLRIPESALISLTCLAKPCSEITMVFYLKVSVPEYSLPTNLNGVELVIFNFDGFIDNSEVVSTGTLHDTLAEFGSALDLEDVRAHFLGTSLKIINAYFEEHKLNLQSADFAKVWQSRLLSAFGKLLKAIPNILDVLFHLLKQNIRFCVASSGSLERIDVAIHLRV